MEQEQKIWKRWDVYLVTAWQENAAMFVTAMKFLERCGITKEQVISAGIKGAFERIGITARSPKIQDHLNCRVRGFFNQFFPQANEVLWQGAQLQAQALKVLRKYKVPTERISRDAEFTKERKKASKSKSRDLPLISGTNAISLVRARKSASDWNTVKPSRCRQRTKRL